METTYFCLQIIFVLISFLIYMKHRTLTYWKRRGVPHDEPHIIYGNMREWRKTKTLHQMYREYYDKYKSSDAPYCGFYSLQRPAIFVLDLELAKNILIKDFTNFTDKGLFYNEKDDPISAHLFFIDGQKWKILRKKLSPTFTSNKMRFMFPTIHAVAIELVTVLEELIETKPHEVDVTDLVSRYTCDIIGTCAFGIECNSLRDPAAEFRKMGRLGLSKLRHGELLTTFMHSYPKLARWLGMKKTPQDVHDFFMRTVREIVTLRETQHIERKDFMNILISLKNAESIKLENGEELPSLTLEEITAQAFLFFLAGFETSSSTMGFMLYELARHQHVQDQLRAEINESLIKYEHVLCYDCIKDMPYLNQVIAETLRMHSILAQVVRKSLNDYEIIGYPNFTIEKDMQIIIPISAIHYDAELYPEPQLFKPERFSAEMLAKRHPLAWLPFSDGPRNCIGKRFGEMQMRVGIALLIKNFKFTVCERTEIPLQYDPKKVLMTSKNGIILAIEKL